MPYYVDVTTGQAEPDLRGVQPSFGLSLTNAMTSTWEENPTSLIADYWKLRKANTGDKVPRAEAEARVKASGFTMTIPEDGYTSDALDILIARKRETAARQLVDERTPWSWIGSPIRGAAALLSGVVDPLNVASAFVPVVREHRAAAMLARAGESGLARAGARAQIGAIEGAAGAAMLEPLVYGLHQQMRDDYGMADSLVNLAFGAALGGGLHMGVGAVADAVRIRPGVVTAEPGTAAHMAQQASPEVREVALRAAVADMAQGKAPEVDAVLRAGTPPTETPEFKAWFGDSKVVDAQGKPMVVYHGAVEGGIETVNAKQTAFFTDDPAIAGKYATDTSGLAPIGRRAEDATPNVQPVFLRLSNPLVVDAAGSNYAAIPFEGGYHLSDALAKEARARGHDGLIVKNVEDNPEGGYQTGPTTNVYAVFDAPGKIKSAVGNSGRFDPNSASLTDPIESIRVARKADAVSPIADPAASRAADERLKAAPKDEGLEAAEAELTEAVRRLSEVQKNLEASGMTPEQIAKMTDGLKRFDEGIADAKNVGAALRSFADCGTRT